MRSSLLVILSLVIGGLIGYLLPSFNLSYIYVKYIEVGLLIIFNTILEIIHVSLKGSSVKSLVIVQFFLNLLISFFLIYIGDRLEIELYLAVTVAWVIKIITNLNFLGVGK